MSPENKAHFLAEKEAIHLIMTGIGDDIYSIVDACQTAQGNVGSNRKLEWSRFVTIVKQQHNLDEVSYDKLFDILKQYQNEVNELRAKKLARNANPLALVASAQASQDQYYQTSRSHRSSAPSSKPSIPSRSHTTTRHKGKEIAKPITPPSKTTFEEDSDPEQAQRDKDMQKNLALIAKYFKKIYKPTNNNLRTSINSKNKNVDTTPRYKNDDHSGKFGNQRTVNAVAARENVRSKEYGNFSKECRKPKRVKDSAYHKEKMLLCKQAEQGVPLQAKQYDWLADTDEEIDKQELEAHYSYMAKIQEVPTADSGTDSKLVEQIQKQLKKANTSLAQGLKECKAILAKTSKSIGESISVRDSCLVALQTKHDESEKFKAFNDRTIDYDKLKRKLNDALGKLAHKDNVIKEGLVKQKTKVIKDLKLMEEHDIEKMLSMEKKLKFLNKIVYKRSQSIQTIHMMAPKVPTYNGRPTFANPRYLKQAQSKISCLYAFPYDQSTHAKRLIPDGEKTLALERESRSKLNKDLVRPYDYTKFNSLYEIFKPPTHEYETQLAHANEIRRKMWRKSFVKSKPNTYKNVGFLPVSKSISKSQQAYNVMTNNIYRFKQIVDDAWIKHSKDLFHAPTAHDIEILIQTCLMPLAFKTQSDSLKFVHKLKVNHKPTVSRPQLKSNQPKDKVLPNNSQVKAKETQVEVYPRIPSVSNKIKSVTACTLHFGNDQFALILGYEDLVQGNVAFRKSTCFVRDLQGNELLVVNRGSDLYRISLQELTSSTPLCLMAKATPTQAWLWHRRLYHLNFDYINLLSKKDIVIGLPKLNSKGRLNLLHMDLYGPMRVASINGKKYIMVIVDDYSRYNWTLFLHSKDETPEVLKDSLMMIQQNLQALVITIYNDRGTEFLNKTLNAFFKEEGIEHQTSTARTPKQNDVVKRQIRTLVEAARTMLSALQLPLFFWAEAIATAFYTQNRSIIIMYVVPTGRVIVPTGRVIVATGSFQMVGSDNECDNASVHNETANTQQQPNIQPQIITTVSNNNAKFPYLKKDEYKVWAMKMEYWITNNDMNIWKVIQNGNSLKGTRRDLDGGSIPDDHVVDFHYMDDARDIWNAVKARFGGNAESKKMRKSMPKKEFLEFRIENTSNLLKHFERINVDFKTAKNDLQIKLDNHLVQNEKWRNSSKNQFKLIDSSVSVRTKVGLGFTNCITTNELGWDDSAYSVFTTTSEDVEGRPIFYRFAKTDSMKVVPPPLTRDYTSVSYHIDLGESQMSYGTKSLTSCNSKSMSNDFVSCDNSDKSSEVNTNDFLSNDSSVKSSEHQPNDSTSCASTSSVSTSVNEVEIESNVRTPIKEPIIVQHFPSFTCNSSDKNEHTCKTSCNKNGYVNKKAGHFRKNASSVSKLCFVCGSGTHLIKDCDLYEKQMSNKTVGI
nr:hypothetical protein [Tanacetum cinerariifolium]